MWYQLNELRNHHRNPIVIGGIAVVSIIVVLSCISCSPPARSADYYYAQIRDKARPYTFDYVSWELSTFWDYFENRVSNNHLNESETQLISRIKDVLKEYQISDVPPLHLSIEEPPHLLVVSTRDKIRYFDRVVLKQQMSVTEMETLESQIDALGFSSLVEELCGFGGTYPPIIENSTDFRFTIDAAVEEWVHQYLFFKPLGFMYFLDSIGVIRNQDVVTMNETVANIFSREVGEEVYSRYYLDSIRTNNVVQNTDVNSFDFNSEMRKTRQQVDILLASGDITGAETYMEQRRQIFWENGYIIRKLNQAYFAFHGIYGADPASVSPIYLDLEKLRNTSASIKDFMDKVSPMTGYDDLINSLIYTGNN